MKKSKSIFALWAIPSQPNRQILVDQVLENNQKFDSLYFTPHMTLALLPRSVKLGPAYDAATLAMETLPVRTRIQSMELGNSYSKTCYYVLEKSPQLMSWAQALKSKLPGKAEWDLDDWMPHISVLYKELSSQEQSLLQKDSPLVGQEITFDEIMLLKTPYPVESMQDQLQWQIHKIKE